MVSRLRLASIVARAMFELAHDSPLIELDRRGVTTTPP